MGLHLPELLVVLVVGLLVFGPKKLPEMGSAIGKSFKAFRKGMNEISNPEDAESPDLAQRDAIPSHKEESGLPNTSTANEEVSAEKHAD